MFAIEDLMFLDQQPGRDYKEEIYKEEKVKDGPLFKSAAMEDRRQCEREHDTVLQVWGVVSPCV